MNGKLSISVSHFGVSKRSVSCLFIGYFGKVPATLEQESGEKGITGTSLGARSGYPAAMHHTFTLFRALVVSSRQRHYLLGNARFGFITGLEEHKISTSIVSILILHFGWLSNPSSGAAEWKCADERLGKSSWKEKHRIFIQYIYLFIGIFI